MGVQTNSVEQCLELAIRHVNAGQPGRALLLCQHAVASYPPHAAVQQLVAVLALHDGQLEVAARSAAKSLELRPHHAPTLIVAGDIARAQSAFDDALTYHRLARSLAPDRADTSLALGLTLHASGNADAAADCLLHAAALAPTHVDIWFALALARQDGGDLAGAEAALRRVIQLEPNRAEAEVNLAIVLQEAGHAAQALQAYGRAYRLNNDAFGRIALALASASTGRLWLDLDALRKTLQELPD